MAQQVSSDQAERRAPAISAKSLNSFLNVGNGDTIVPAGRLRPLERAHCASFRGGPAHLVSLRQLRISRHRIGPVQAGQPISVLRSF